MAGRLQLLVHLVLLLSIPLTVSQNINDTLGISSGYLTYQTNDFDVKLVKSAQVLASLVPRNAASFDFLPFAFIGERAADRKYHTGDLLFRYRRIGDNNSPWIEQDTSAARKPVIANNATNSTILAGSDLSPGLHNSLLHVERYWGVQAGGLTLSFAITNNQYLSIELGSLGFALESDSIFTDRTAVDINANCSLIDPNIGLNGGYLRFTRINGQGPAMVVTPLNDDTPLEGWGFLQENNTGDGYQTETFEGLYQWMSHTLAYKEKEWNSTDPWNVPTSRVIQAGETLNVGLRFSLVDQIEQIESAVRNIGLPVAKGLPGYIIPQDLESILYVDSPSNITSVSTDPLDAFRTSANSSSTISLSPNTSTFGRVRLTINYADGKNQTVHYHISKSAPEAVREIGDFLSNRHWWTNTSDPFGRAPSLMAVDNSDGVGSLILQEARVWLAGECHEAGASWLTMSIKQVAQPVAEEVAKLEDFVHGVLWKTIQRPNLTVPQSIFWYDPNRTDFVYDPSIDWQEDTPTHYGVSWSAARANVTTRAYGYIYPATTYWSLYRVGRAFPAFLAQKTWRWYLSQAYKTIQYCFQEVNGTHLQPLWYDGLMGETVIGELLKDLYREGWSTEASEIESLMRSRSDKWETTAIPFGS